MTETEIDSIKALTISIISELEDLAEWIEELNDKDAIEYKTWILEKIKTRPFVPITAVASIRVAKITP